MGEKAKKEKIKKFRKLTFFNVPIFLTTSFKLAYKRFWTSTSLTHLTCAGRSGKRGRNSKHQLRILIPYPSET